MATVVAAGLKTVREITKVQVPGGGGSGGGSVSAPSITAPAPIAPTQTSTKIVDIDENSALSRPVRTYMVEQDNAAAVDRAMRLANASKLGGGK